MRKFYMLFVALFVSAFVSYASAQESYPPTGQDCGTYTVLDAVRNAHVGTSGSATSHNDNPKRFCMGLPLQPKYGTTAYGAIQRLTFNDGILYPSNYTNYPSYNNLTWLKENNYVTNGTFTLKVGQQLSPAPTKGVDLAGLNSDLTQCWDGAWMAYAVYVDYPIDNNFSLADRVLYGNGDPGNFYRDVTTFRAPTEPGTYRYRVVTGDYSNPQGSASMVYNGGMIVDANITLVRPNVTFDYNSRYVTVTPSTAAGNLVCGVDYTFTVTPKAGCEVTSVTARVGDEAVYQDINLASSDGTYTVPAAQFQNDMVITINAGKRSFTAAQAAAGECYFRLKNKWTDYGTRYLKAAIATVPEDFTGDRVTGGAATLFTHTLEENNASYIWKLVPIDGSSSFYLTSQGYKIGQIGDGDDQTIRMSKETGSPVTVGTYNGYYTFTTGSHTGSGTNNSFMHALRYGQSVEDSTYPTNTEGNYVASWAASADASHWTIEPIESFTVTIGTGGWSSFNYAFPIAFYADEVSNVYISTSENTGVVTLAPIAVVDGMIYVPSNTPIFVEGTEGANCTVDLLTEEPTTNVSGNTLRGTTLPQTATLTSGETAYVIATPSGKETALYRLGADVKIPVNKAYYVSGQQQTSKLGLNFGEVTEISNAVTAQPALKDEILYDLRGHRVVYPTRGIYVTGSGRKIFVK